MKLGTFTLPKTISSLPPFTMVCSCVHVHATYYLHVHTYQHVTHIPTCYTHSNMLHTYTYKTLATENLEICFLLALKQKNRVKQRKMMVKNQVIYWAVLQQNQVNHLLTGSCLCCRIMEWCWVPHRMGNFLDSCRENTICKIVITTLHCACARAPVTWPVSTIVLSEN